MLKKITSYLLVLLLALPFTSFSKEKKEKEKKLNKKEMKAAMDGLNTSVEDLKKKIAQLEEDKSVLEQKVNNLTSENETVKKEATAAKAQVETTKQEVAKATAASVTPGGLTFKVQIGAYQMFRIASDFEKAKNVTTEDVDGFKKYIIGYFGDLNQAEAFTKDVKKMGIQDAWIVPYNDGKRISDEQAEQLLGKPFRDKTAKPVKVAKKAKTAAATEPAK